MRFAYIDSQGNEVTIPSVDALALRIELGAIGPETDLYDAQADRWGPAHSHEIFHTLSRDVGGDEFLVPAPPTPTPEEPEGPAEIDAPSADAPSPPSPSAPPLYGSFGLTLAPSEDDGADATARPPNDGPADATAKAGFADRSLDPAPSGPTGPVAPPTGPVAPPTGESGAGRPAEEIDATEYAFEFDGVETEPETAEGEGAGIWLEDPLDPDMGEDRGGEPANLGGGLDLEPPMSDFDPSSPPAWMEQDGPAGFADDGPAMDFSPDAEGPGLAEGSGWGASEAEHSPASGSARPGPKPYGEERPARKGPPRAPPRRSPRRRHSFVRPLLLLLLVGGVGAGGWYGWKLLAERPGTAPPRPAVVIPDIPAELDGPMRELAGEALPLMYGEIESRAFPPEEPQAPSEEWLAGVYLGNASRFAEVEAFWSAVAGFAGRLRNEEVESFHAAYASLAEATDHDDDTRAILVERADSGFIATREVRMQVYDRLDTLAGAALALHDFLLTHESDIVYTPARAFAGNPIEEVVPSSPEIGDQMWDRVEDITNALDALGTLDRVTRERLSTVVLQRIRDIGIR
jgi:hypothetical protein